MDKFKNMDPILLGIYGDKYKVYWDFINSPNAMATITGTLGTGKTFFSLNLAIEIAKRGGTVLIIDQHRILAEDQIPKLLKADYNQFRNDTYAVDGIPINLFQELELEDGRIEKKESVVSSITKVIADALKFGPDQSATLRKAIEDVVNNGAYDTDGFKAIREELLKLGTKKSVEVNERMYPLFIYNLFVKGDGMIREGMINTVHLTGTDLECQHISAEIIMSLVNRYANAGYFNKLKGAFFVFLDECQNYNSGDNSPVSQLMSEGRKMNVNLILSTQMILKGTTSKLQQRLTLAGLQIYFRPASDRVALTARMISDTNKENLELSLAGLDIGQFVAKGNLLLETRKVKYPIIVDSYRSNEEEIECDVDVNYTVNGDAMYIE